jgi:hypothetical protein
MSFVPTSTVARSASNTMTAARVRNVMLEVAADFNMLAIAGLAEYEKCVEWCTDLIYLLEHEAVTSFQLQFKCAGYLPLALEYVISADGTLQSSDKAGGIDYFALPDGTRASLCVSLNYQSRDIEAVKAYLSQHGWGFNGQAVTGIEMQDRIYSSDGYGVIRNKIGAWQ